MGLVDNDRERLIHVISYFLKNTKHCYKMKLYKLIYFADVRHFQETGKPITNLEYFAWPMGPVPVSLHEDIDNANPNLTKFIKIVQSKALDPETDSKAVVMSSAVGFDEDLFSPREIRILKEVAEIYKEVKSSDISEISHDRSGPWYRVYVTEKRKQQLIPLIYSLDDKMRAKVSKDRAIELANTKKELKKRFG